MGNSVNVWIVIPAGNAENTISDALYEYSKMGDGRSLHFVVVSDGSTDSTCERVLEISRDLGRVRLLKNSGVYGRGSAALKGILYSIRMSKNRDVIALLCPEKRFKISELEKMIGVLERGSIDGVLSKRYNRTTKPEAMKTSNYLFSLFYNKMTNLFFGLDYTDIQCPAKVFKRDALEKVIDKTVIRGEGFDLNLIYEMKLAGMKLDEVHIRTEPEAEYPHMRCNNAIDTVLDTLWYRLYRTDFYKSMRERMHDF